MGIPIPIEPPVIVAQKWYWVSETQFYWHGCTGITSEESCCVSSNALQQYLFYGMCSMVGINCVCLGMLGFSSRMTNCIGPFDSYKECLESGCY